MIEVAFVTVGIAITVELIGVGLSDIDAGVGRAFVDDEAVGHEIAGVFFGDAVGVFPIVAPNEEVLHRIADVFDDLTPDEEGNERGKGDGVGLVEILESFTKGPFLDVHDRDGSVFPIDLGREESELVLLFGGEG